MSIEALDIITKIRLAQQAMESACKRIDELKEENKNLKAALAKQEQGEPVAWTENDMAYRPNGLPQEFIHHEVESPDDWSEWVCPKPEQYFLKCCDCGLVHEAQFRVAKYGEGDYCELVEDKDTQAQFRMRRRTTPQQRTWVGLTEQEQGAIMESLNAYGTNLYHFANAIEAKLKEKNT